MTQRRDVDTYRLTLSELLHEVCVELLDGQDMLEDLSAQRREHQEMDQTADGPHAPAVYEFAEEQIRLRLKRYRELGDRIDEIITLYNELADEVLAEDDDDEIGETFSYTGDADWLEWQEIKRKSEDDEYEEDDDDDDSNYETDDDPDDESDRVQEWSLKKKKKDKKKDKKEKKDKKDKKEKKHKDKESKDKSEVDAKKLKKAEESSQATVTTIVENRVAKASEGTPARKPAAKKKPARKTAAKRSAATTKAKRKTAAKPAAKPKVASKK